LFCSALSRASFLLHFVLLMFFVITLPLICCPNFMELFSGFVLQKGL
jgi:hypothetical protein